MSSPIEEFFTPPAYRLSHLSDRVLDPVPFHLPVRSSPSTSRRQDISLLPQQSTINSAPAVPLQMLPPPNERIYDSLAALEEDIKRSSALQGYALGKAGDRTSRSGEVTKRWFRCDRYAKPSVSTGTNRKRERVSHGCGCLFKGYAKRDNYILSWSFKLSGKDQRTQLHNHGPSGEEAHPIHRRLESEHLAFIDNEDQRRIEPRKTLSELRAKFPTHKFDLRRLYNARCAARRLRLGPYTPTQALLQELENTEEWTSSYNVDKEDRLDALFFTHRHSIEWLRKYPDILFIDCTYKTNRYNMPLLIMTATTACNKTFYIGFCFIKAETEEYYKWAVQQLRNIYTQYALPEPVVVTDKEDALIQALGIVFPQSRLLQCRWHINKNVLKHAVEKGDFENNEDASKWNTAWYGTINAQTMEEYQEALQHLSTLNEEMFRYVSGEYLGPQASKLVAAFTNDITHFNKLTTSTSESAHASLKARLTGRTGNLRMVVCEVHDLIRDRAQDLQQIHENSKINHRVLAMQIPVFRYLLGNISTNAMDLLLERWSLISKTPTCFNRCTGVYQKTQGLPCAHEIQRAMFEVRPLRIVDCHRHWHINPLIGERPDIDLRTLVQEPIKIRGKGRPSHDTSTKRQKSGFEYVVHNQIAKSNNRKEGQEQPQTARPVFRNPKSTMPHIIGDSDTPPPPPKKLTKKQEANQKRAQKAAELQVKKEKDIINKELKALGATTLQLLVLHTDRRGTFLFNLQMLKYKLRLQKLKAAADQEDYDMNTDLYNKRMQISNGRDNSWEQMDDDGFIDPRLKVAREDFEEWAEETGYMRPGPRREGPYMQEYKAYLLQQEPKGNEDGNTEASTVLGDPGRSTTSRPNSPIEESSDSEQERSIEEASLQRQPPIRLGCVPGGVFDWLKTRRATKQPTVNTEAEVDELLDSTTQNTRKRNPTKKIDQLEQEGLRIDGTKARGRSAGSPPKGIRASKKIRVFGNGDRALDGPI